MECEQTKEECKEEVHSSMSEIERVKEEKWQTEKDIEQYGIDLLSNAAQLQTLQEQLNT